MHNRYKIVLFIPCYIDLFYPQVGIAAFELLTKLGLDVHYPLEQICCGQPLADAGAEKEGIPVYKHFVSIFNKFDFLFSPSKRYALKIVGIILASNKMYHFIKKMMRWIWQNLPVVRRYVWGKERELPNIPRESFQQWYRKNFQRKGGAGG